MKSLNKLIFHYVSEIIVTLLFVVISVPVWNVLNKSDAAKIAESYSNMDYLYLDVNKYVGTDSFKDEIAVINDTNTNREYQLLVKINKDKEVKNENVVINEQKSKLSTLKYKEDSDYNYYLLAEGNVVADQEKYDIYFENSELNYYEVEYDIVEFKNI